MSNRTDSLFEVEEIEQAGLCNHIIRVAFESAVDSEFDYLVPDSLWPVGAGQRVEVPFGRKNKIQTGFCTQADIPPEESFIARKGGRRLKKAVRVM